jgi:hypothetical protein
MTVATTGVTTAADATGMTAAEASDTAEVPPKLAAVTVKV